MEMALMEGTNCRVVARRYEVSKSALSRHRTEHLTRELAAGRTRTEEDAERQDELLQRLDWMRETPSGPQPFIGAHQSRSIAAFSPPSTSLKTSGGSAPILLANLARSSVVT